MKMSKSARVKSRLMSGAEKKKVVSAARTLFDAGLISVKRAALISRNFR
jgi:hypothetical protein